MRWLGCFVFVLLPWTDRSTKLSRTINGGVPQPKPLPMPDKPWVIRRVVDADENPWIEMTIEYPLPMPYAVGEMELEFGQGSAIPEMIKVWAEGPKLCPDLSLIHI